MKPRRAAIVLVVLLTASAGVAGPALAGTADGAGAGATQQQVTLTVSVENNIGDPVSGATLTASWDGGQVTEQTRSNGQALIDVPEGADVEIAFEHEEYTLNNPVEVDDAETEEVSFVVFAKANAEVTVAQNGVPVEGARVTLFKSGESRPAAVGRTDGNGVFTSGTVERGTYTVRAFKPGYYRNETSVSVQGTTETSVALSEGTVTVEIAVNDGHFDPPRAVEDASIRIEGLTSASLETGGGGTGTIGLPVNAKYTVSIEKDGYTSRQREITTGEEATNVVFTITRTDALTVEAVNQRVVVGEKVQLAVTDEYGDAVANATVTVDGDTVGETDEEGVYRATIESAGSHTITAEKGGVTSGEITVEGVSAGGDTPPDTATATGSEAPSDLPDFGQPGFAVKVGVAAVGVLLAFLVVRMLL